MTDWNAALTAALGVIPGGTICDPQQIADAIRALMHDESPRGMAERNIGKACKFAENQTGTIRGLRTDAKKGRLCYVVAWAFGTVELAVESVEVV